jgi:hypothetical protein
MGTYPQIVDYAEVMQHPETAFVDPELKRGTVTENNLGLPLAMSGGFALTYQLTVGTTKYAVRCFHRQVPAVEQKYKLIAQGITQLHSPYFVPFAFQALGIRVRSMSYPIVRMEWIEGPTLGLFIERSYARAESIRQLRSKFQSLEKVLRNAGVAHGDLQNGNLIVSASGEVRLIDYDGMYVPGMTIGAGSEVGHKHFQHPDRDETTFGPDMDRFSFIAIDLSLQALLVEPSLHQKFSEGGETIIFKANDFSDPEHSEVFTALRRHRDLARQANDFAAICEADVSTVPTLEDFLAGRNIPKVVRAAIGAGAKAGVQTAVVAPTVPAGYIGAYEVVDATDYRRALAQVGNRVELVGRIVEVKASRTRHGKPYVFINFGPWKRDIVKLTIWSEGLSHFSQMPSQAWEGRWVSVIGLLDPPFVSRRYKYTHLSVTVGHPSEVNFLTEADAQFRLRSIGQPAAKRNRGLLATLLGSGAGQSTRSGSSNPVATPSGSRGTGGSSASNQDVLDRIRRAQTVGSAGGTAGARGTRSHSQRVAAVGASGPGAQPPTTRLSRIPWWVWLVAGFVVWALLAQGGKPRSGTEKSGAGREEVPAGSRVLRAPSQGTSTTPREEKSAKGFAATQPKTDGSGSASPETKGKDLESRGGDAGRTIETPGAPSTPSECPAGYVRRGSNECVSSGVPANAHVSRYGGGWECDRGFADRNRQCVPVELPANAKLDYTGHGWDCERGYSRRRSECLPVEIPANAQLDYTGHGWQCSRGFAQRGAECMRIELPANAKLDYTGRGWDCERGYSRRGGECPKVEIPANAQLDYTGHGWQCSRGFAQRGAECTRIELPANAKLDYTGRGWDCERGYSRRGGECPKVEIPANAQLDYSGHGWECSRGFARRGTECIEIQPRPR